jgi:hypothetical protein
MSFNFVAGKPAHPINLSPIMSGNFTGDIDGDGTDLENVSHIGQTNAAEGRLVFFDSTTTGLAGNERNLRGNSSLTYDNSSNVFSIGGGMVHNRSSITSHYSIQRSDYYIGCNHTASITVTLPYASTLSAGQTFTIKDEVGLAETYNITIVRQGSDLIDGQQNIIIESPYGALNLYSNGNNKFFIF